MRLSFVKFLVLHTSAVFASATEKHGQVVYRHSLGCYYVAALGIMLVLLVTDLLYEGAVS